MATTITSSGNLLNIDRNDKTLSYAKEGISIKVKAGSYLSIRFENKEVQLIRDSERASVTPSSSSLADLQTKILAFMPASSGGGSEGSGSSAFDIAKAKIRQILSIADLAMLSNIRTKGVMISPPTVSINETFTDPTLSKYYRVADPVNNVDAVNDKVFTYTGGTPKIFYGDALKFPSATVSGSGENSDNGQASRGWRVAMMTDASKITFRVMGNNTYKFLVNGQYISNNTYTNAGGGFRQITLAFASRKVREIQVEANQGSFFGGANVSPQDTIYKISKPFKLVGVGDSLLDSSNASWTSDGFIYIAGDYLGFKDVVASAVGGSGWDNANTGQKKPVDRLADWTTKNPDVLAFFYGVNGNDHSEYQAAVSNVLTLTRAALPNVPVIVFGPWTGVPGPSVSTLSKEAKIKAAVLAFNDSLMQFRATESRPEGPILSGSGRVTAKTGDGNTDNYTDFDEIHWTNEGHDFIGRWVAGEIYEGLRLML